MIDHIFGRPNPSWKRAQVFLVISFWIWRILKAREGPPRVLWLPRINRNLQRFSPWQLILSTLTAVYALRNLDKILGLEAPEPLANLYSPEYYRATWIATGLDTGFATAMYIRPRWLRDTCSLLFAVYYILFPTEADEKLRRFRAVPTVEMLRATWNKTTHPLIRLIQRVPPLSVRRKILLPRPKGSSYDRPITAHLFFALPEHELKEATELILDFPGGGFVAMTPEHHEERLRFWAVKSKRPVLSIDYGKAPEYPYPFAIDEVFDVYQVLIESAGRIIGMSGQKMTVIVSGDSAGGTLAVNLIIRLLEVNNTILKHGSKETLPLPTGVVLTYAALDFNFAPWMSADHLRVIRAEQSSGHIPGMREFAEQKDHLHHVSPLSMVPDRKRKKIKRQSSWRETLKGFTSGGEESSTQSGVKMKKRGDLDEGALADAESGEEDDYAHYKEEDKPIKARVKFKYDYPRLEVEGVLRTRSELEEKQEEMQVALKQADLKAVEAWGGSGKKSKEPIGTRLTMSSRAGYFQDRIISPSMMRAMAILYIGPHRNPDFTTDYHISPILTPEHLLAQFPPLMIQCGEKDPFVDDNVVFAGKVREAKRKRKIELELALKGKRARFGEDTVETGSGSKRVRSVEEMRRERDRLASESEFDWVQLVLLADWSHGYLQMPTLMPSARAVIDDLAEWMDETFKRYRRTPYLERVSRMNGLSPGGEVSTSEAEASDSGIMFVSKRSGSSGSDGGRSKKQGSPARHQSESPKPRETNEEGGSWIAGHTITELELMRRRRLQDSHLFDSHNKS